MNITLYCKLSFCSSLLRPLAQNRNNNAVKHDILNAIPTFLLEKTINKHVYQYLEASNAAEAFETCSSLSTTSFVPSHYIIQSITNGDTTNRRKARALIGTGIANITNGLPQWGQHKPSLSNSKPPG